MTDTVIIGVTSCISKSFTVIRNITARHRLNITSFNTHDKMGVKRSSHLFAKEYHPQNTIKSNAALLTGNKIRESTEETSHTPIPARSQNSTITSVTTRPARADAE